jgi:PD-(D/E)XK nuclease superfamily
MLKRATFPDIWTRSGYPGIPTRPLLIGNIIHRALERVIRELSLRSCTSANTADATAVLRSLGGLTVIITATAADALNSLEDNPRASHRIPALRRDVLSHVPDMRQRVQSLISRTRIVPRQAGIRDRSMPGRNRLGFGSHCEMDVQESDLGWVGRIDLLNLDASSCEIVDYKTGSTNENHVEQVRAYAVLWHFDSVLNPTGRIATRLVLRYPDVDRVVEAPSIAELPPIRAAFAKRTGDATKELSQRPPPARPSDTSCPTCSVRQLCSDYWTFLDTMTGVERNQSAGGFGDAEVLVTERHGPKSWKGQVTHATRPGVPILIRTRMEAVTFAVGRRVRILNAVINEEDAGDLVLTLTADSETFQTDLP